MLITTSPGGQGRRLSVDPTKGDGINLRLSIRCQVHTLFCARNRPSPGDDGEDVQRFEGGESMGRS
jgi:hypothetical protein